MVKGEGLHTVCQEAGCPNIFECWEDREATFLIGGDTCTRRCDFCDIATGRPQPLDLDEPRRVAESVRDDGAALLHRHRCRPRRPARRCRRSLRRDDPPDPRAQPQHRRRDPPARLRRRARARRPGLRRPPRGVRAQPRDGAAHLQADPPRLHLRQVAAGPHAWRAMPSLVTKSNLILGHGRGGPRDRGGDPRPARRGLRHPHDHPVPAPLPQAPPDRPLGQAGGVRPLVRRGRGRRLQGRHGRPARAQLATAPVGSGPPRCTGGAARSPSTSSHLEAATGDPARQEAASLVARAARTVS